MKATIFAAVALALSAASYAAEPNSGEAYQSDIHFVSTKTRAEVKAETLAALKRGEVIAGESYPFNVQPQTAPARTRADVKAELAHTTQAGALRNEH
jgi:hypothetical protein